MFTLYAAVKAPLLLGSDPSRMGKEYLDIAMNEEIIAVNQDSLGVAAYAVAASTEMVGLELAPCPAKMPVQHHCCDHPHCRPRNESECGAMPNCCYKGTAHHGQCWLNAATPPPGPPEPKPPPAPPQPTPDAGGLLTFCQWGAITASQQWLVDDDGRVLQDSICLERPVESAVGAALTLAACSPGKPTQVFETMRGVMSVNETLAQIRVPAASEGSPEMCVGTDGHRVLLGECLKEDPACMYAEALRALGARRPAVVPQ